MPRRTRKNLITSKEKIMLHLLSQHRFYQDSAAPETVTQDGISEAVEIGRNNVSKFLKDLQGDEIVEVQIKHIKGAQRVRNVYFLSHLGFQDALRLKGELESIRTRVILFDGNEVEEEVGRLNLHLPRSYSIVELASGVERGTFDCASFHEGKIKEERRYVDYTERKPAVRAFFGRKEELSSLRDFMGSKDVRLMVVHGIAGIGKTTLLAKFAQEIRESVNIFWYKVHEWVTLKIMLAPLAEFLSQLGKKGLERYLAQTDSPSVGEVCTLLEGDMTEVEALIVFDDVQKSDPLVVEFLGALVSILPTLEGVRVMITSREIPSFYNRTDIARGVIEEMPLSGLDRESAGEMLLERSITKSDADTIYRATNGHPLFLQLIDDPKTVLGKNVRKFIEQEVYIRLDITERRILEIASVFRYPVTVEAFFTIEEELEKAVGRRRMDMGYDDYMVDYDTIDVLLSMSLLQESIGRMISMHDLIREFFYSRLRPKQKVSLHKAASLYYLEDSSAPAYVEALFHSLRAGELEKAISIAASHGRDIISKGYGAQLAPLVREIIENAPIRSVDDRMELLTLMGQMLDIQGEWDEAMEQFKEIFHLATPERDRRILADVNRRMGCILLRRGKHEEALEHLDQSKSLAEKGDDIHTLVDVLYDLGGLYERAGKDELAIEFFERSRDMARSIMEEMGEGKALYGIGRVYGNLMDYDRAIEYKEEALSVLERIGDTSETAKVYTSIGNDLRARGDMDASLRYQIQAIDLARSVGDLNTLGYAFSNAAASYLEMGVMGESEDLIERASEIFSKLGDMIMLSTMHLYKGYLHYQRGDWEHAKEEFGYSLDIMRELEAPIKLSNWLYEIGKIYLEKDEGGEATSMFEEALEIATRMGHENLCRDLKMVMEPMA